MALQKNSSTSSLLLLLLLLLPPLLLLCPTKTSALSYAKPGCPEHCGDVTIPYPFGIGPNCFLEEWFSIECKNTSTNTYNGLKPYLAKINLEVLEISLNLSHIRVNNPVTSPNCLNNNINSNSSVDLRFSPFHFQETANVFMAVGVNCSNQNQKAIIADLDNKFITQCSTTCDAINNITCATEISPFVQYLQVYRVELGNNQSVVVAAGTPCVYAFVVESETQVLMGVTQNFTEAVQTHVPAVLAWVVKCNTTEVVKCSTTELGLVPDNNRNSYSCFPMSQAYSSSSDGRCGVVQSIQCFCNFPFVGNPYFPNGCLDVCTTDNAPLPLCNKTDTNSNKVIIGVCAGLAGGLFLLIAIGWFYKVIKKRNDKKRKENFFKRNGGFFLQHKLSSSDDSVEKIKFFSSKELEKATDHYNENRILGQGGQGAVYKGMLSDGRIIAVKKSIVVDKGKVEQFINEVVILSQIIHRNIVKLLGCCLETDVPLLVYEFIPNGTLSQHIYDPNEEFPLSWEMRFQIAIEVAGALSYLHYTASIPIYHRDMKSTNILLDDKYKAKVSDFGISTSIDVDRTHLTTQVQGTFGYLDPEYFQSNQFTDKSDVYSFGVVIIELLTGQKPISSTRSQESRSLVMHFMQLMEENRLLEILDPRILKEGRKEEMIVVAHLARRCLNLNGKKRPTMKDVAVELEGIRMSQGGSTTHQHYEEVEYNTTELIEAWDIASTSTGTFLDSNTTSTFDAQPLLHNKS